MSTLTSRVVAGCARSPGIREISRGGAPGRVARRRAPHSPSRSSSTTRMSPVRASAGPVDGFVPAIDAAARDVAASIPPLASSSLSVTHPIADVAVDAWSVSGGTTLGVRFAGVETKLFQAGLLPYLVYLYFLGKDEANTPPASNFGARFLLLFVFATIPAGITAKTKYGDILANVDLLHGSSESLLTVSNFLFAFGFAAALADATATTGGGSVMMGERDVATEGERDARMSAPAALFTFLAAAGSGCAALAFAGQSAGLASALHEPSNALSVPTWAVHVSSVTEWSVAMRLVWVYAGVSGNAGWRNLSFAMAPFLASGFAACTFHLFYNAPAINALVPLQALLTLTGNCACGLAAWSIVKEGERLETTEGGWVNQTLTDSEFASSPDAFDWAPRPTLGSVLKLAAWSTIGAAGVKYAPLLCGDFFLTPTYEKALAVVAAPTLVWSFIVFTTPGSSGAGDVGDDSPADSFWSNLSMDKVKSYGKAGTVSYVLVELAFWAIAFPVAFGWYGVAEGTWLDISDPADKARLFGAGAVFINGVRALVPLRLAAAIALAPAVESAMGGDADESDESDDV